MCKYYNSVFSLEHINSLVQWLTEFRHRHQTSIFCHYVKSVHDCKMRKRGSERERERRVNLENKNVVLGLLMVACNIVPGHILRSGKKQDGGLCRLSIR